MIISANHPSAIDLTIAKLLAGEVIALPTDTVYGLATLANNQNAVEKLYKIKDRSSQKPISVLMKDLEVAKSFLDFSPKAQAIAQKYLPGKLTMVLETKQNWQKKLAVNLNQNFQELDGGLKIGFRIIDAPFFKKLFKKFDEVIALTSANKAGDPAICNPQEIQKLFPDILVIDDGVLNGKPSTVISVIDDEVKILRQGDLKILL